MFDMSLGEHLRLTFGHVVYSHKAHLEQAERLARREARLRVLELFLILLICAAAGAAFLRVDPRAPLATVALAVLTLLIALWRGAITNTPLIFAHRACAARLWLIREKYQALLADLSDGTIEAATARERRDALMEELHGMYEHAPPTDKRAYKRARRALSVTDEVALSDEEIDHFLPQSLRKSDRSGPDIGPILGRTI